VEKHKQYNIAILIAALIFSSILGFKFTLNGGFSFLGFWYESNILDFLNFSFELEKPIHLKSQIIGHILFIIFGIRFYKQNPEYRKATLLIVFFIVTSFAILNDLYKYLKDIADIYKGHQYKLGTSLFIIAIYFSFYLGNNQKKLSKKTTSLPRQN
jgi:hypothetical protein